jgi:site-specific recombinase XerD
MTRPAGSELFTLVRSFFTEYLPHQRGASSHTIRAYRDALKLLFEFIAQRNHRDFSALVVEDLDAQAVAAFRQPQPSKENCSDVVGRSAVRRMLPRLGQV